MQAAGLASAAAASVCLLLAKRGYGVHELAPIFEALDSLASAIGATAAPVEVHPDLYRRAARGVVVALVCLVENRAWGTAFMAMPESRLVLWIKQILAKEQV